jgi:hypothetical protein
VNLGYCKAISTGIMPSPLPLKPQSLSYDGPEGFGGIIDLHRVADGGRGSQKIPHVD